MSPEICYELHLLGVRAISPLEKYFVLGSNEENLVIEKHDANWRKRHRAARYFHVIEEEDLLAVMPEAKIIERGGHFICSGKEAFGVGYSREEAIFSAFVQLKFDKKLKPSESEEYGVKYRNGRIKPSADLRRTYRHVCRPRV